MKRVNKGEHNYIKSQTKYVLMITIFMYACAFGIYFFGLYINHTYKNIWSVIAVLSMLPASKSLVNLIMFLRFRSLDFDTYNEYKAVIKDMKAIYELPFTTYEKTFFVDCITACDNTIVGYINPDKNKLGVNDIKKLEEHLENTLKIDEHKKFSVKIFDKKDVFLKRVMEMNNNLTDYDNSSSGSLLNSFKAVIL